MATAKPYPLPDVLNPLLVRRPKPATVAIKLRPLTMGFDGATPDRVRRAVAVETVIL